MGNGVESGLGGVVDVVSGFSEVVGEDRSGEVDSGSDRDEDVGGGEIESVGANVGKIGGMGKPASKDNTSDAVHVAPSAVSAIKVTSKLYVCFSVKSSGILTSAMNESPALRVCPATESVRLKKKGSTLDATVRLVTAAGPPVNSIGMFTVTVKLALPKQLMVPCSSLVHSTRIEAPNLFFKESVWEQELWNKTDWRRLDRSPVLLFL